MPGANDDSPADEPAPTAEPPSSARPSRWRRGVAACKAAALETKRFFVHFKRDPKGVSKQVYFATKQGVVAYVQPRVSFSVVFAPLLILSVLVYTRSFWTNYIFDEQEALLANPYVNGGGVAFWDVFRRDFWGLPPERTIGTYRPIPNIVWRLIWHIKHHAWLPHFVNVFMHGVNGALLAVVMQRWMNSRMAAWFSGVALVLAAIITEAVCGVVGIADVLGGTFILLCLWAFQLTWYWAALLTLVFLFLGLLCKESTMTVTPLVGWAALVAAPLVHPHKPQRWLRFLSVGMGAAIAVIGYTYFRRHFFPITLPPELQKPLPNTEPTLKWALHEFLRWFQQPKFATDPINNPLAEAEPLYRISGALRVYFRSLVQIVFPWQLSGDYSYPQEPVPEKLLTIESFLGGLLMFVPPAAAVVFWARGAWVEFTRRWRLRTWSKPALLEDGSFRIAETPAEGAAEGTRALTWITPRLRGLALVAVAAMWVPLTYFPQSNIPLIMPTVRAERFWYVPVLGSSMLIGWGFMLLWRRAKKKDFTRWALAITIAFFGFQAVRARSHAFDYRNDLTFWRATAKAVPNSCKAHLNYGVMLGARRRLDLRLEENKRALELAPEWPMANIYVGDTLCRLHRPDEAMPHYLRGFELGPNQQFMVALALQCLWEEKAFERHREKIEEVGKKHPGSWVDFLVKEMVKTGEEHQGVDPKYRPRGYNQGPRKE